MRLEGRSGCRRRVHLAERGRGVRKLKKKNKELWLGTELIFCWQNAKGGGHQQRVSHQVGCTEFIHHQSREWNNLFFIFTIQIPPLVAGEEQLRKNRFFWDLVVLSEGLLIPLTQWKGGEKLSCKK